jgi:predicted phosphodiesterase
MQLPSTYEYIIIGDVHGCIDELKSLLIKQDFLIDNNNLIQDTKKSQHKSIILLGDFVDKASEEKLIQTIEFIYKNFQHLNQTRERFYLILGNHEDMVYRYLSNDSSLIINEKTIKNKEKYYNTVALLEKMPYLKKLFLELHEACSIWYKYEYNEKFSVTLTHAPCPQQYLTQDGKESRGKMIKCVSRSKNPKLPLDQLIPYTHEEAKENQHYHIFGHLSQPNIRQYKNKICIDTSAIYGDTLSCAIIKEESISFDSVPFENKQKKGKQSYNKLFDF